MVQVDFVKKEKDSNFSRKNHDYSNSSDDFDSRRKDTVADQNADSTCKLADGDRWGAILRIVSLPNINNMDLCLNFMLMVGATQNVVEGLLPSISITQI